MTELVTIITPTYNRGHLLERAINSVLTQTYKNWELLVVDDASTDNTADVMSQFTDERIRYIHYGVNGGNAKARNVGVKNAKGDYIAFVDSDDEYHPTYLDKAIKLLHFSPDSSFLWAGTRTVAVDKTYKESIWIPTVQNHFNQFLYQLHVGIGRGFLIKKQCFEHLTFDENLRTAVDTDFLIRLRQKFNFTVLQEVLLNIHTQPGSVRSNYSEKKKSYNIIIKKHQDLIDQDKKLKLKWYYKLFWLSLYDGDKKLSRLAYSKIAFTGIKPTILLGIFTALNKEKAMKIHKKLSK